MLTARPAKRDRSNFLSNDLRWEIVSDDTPIGGMRYDRKHLRAEVTIGDADFTVARAEDRPDEPLYRAMLRVMAGGDKPAPNPFALKDAAGQVLALAERAKRGFAVSQNGMAYMLRKGPSRPFHLYRCDSDISLGWVGQERFWAQTLGMNLPAEFTAAFQVFLLVLLLNLTMEQLE